MRLHVEEFGDVMRGIFEDQNGVEETALNVNAYAEDTVLAPKSARAG